MSIPSARSSLRNRCERSNGGFSPKRFTAVALRLEIDYSAGPGIFQGDEPDIGQIPLARIFNMDGNQVVTTIRLASDPTQVGTGSGGITARLEIRYQEHDRTPM